MPSLHAAAKALAVEKSYGRRGKIPTFLMLVFAAMQACKMFVWDRILWEKSYRYLCGIGFVLMPGNIRYG